MVNKICCYSVVVVVVVVSITVCSWNNKEGNKSDDKICACGCSSVSFPPKNRFFLYVLLVTAFGRIAIKIFFRHVVNFTPTVRGRDERGMEER